MDAVVKSPIKVIDYDRAKTLLEAAVEERGAGYVYETPPADGLEYADSCRYWHPSQNAPGCGVGLLLFKEGVSPESLIRLDECISGKNACDITIIDGVELTDGARKFLQVFQLEQDSGKPWGESLREAIEHSEPDGIPQ